jgi:hypothetical protein
MTVQVPVNQCAGIVIYLLAITGISLLATKLSSLVAEQASVLALTYLDNGPPKLSLIERRRIEAKQAAPPLPEGARRRVAVLEASSMPANILAARLDLAEMEDLIGLASTTRVASGDDGSLGPASHSSSITAAKFRTVHADSKYAAVSARDVFNRSFGGSGEPVEQREKVELVLEKERFHVILLTIGLRAGARRAARGEERRPRALSHEVWETQG